MIGVVLRVLAISVPLVAVASECSFAQSKEPKQTSRATPMPAIPKGQGQSCVAPTDWMRRYHMTVLNHQRDKTVHAGVRAGPFDLKGCIECHAVPGADGKPVSASDPKHFCRGCHDYAAVSMDCFECHASRPHASRPVEGQRSSIGTLATDVAALERYLAGGKP